MKEAIVVSVPIVRIPLDEGITELYIEVLNDLRDIPMKNAFIAFVSVTVGFLFGFLVHSHIADRPGTVSPDTGQDGPPSREGLSQENVTIRIEPIPSAEDSHEANLVLQQQGRTRQRWPLGNIWADEWSQVPVNRSTKGNTQAWWLSWRVGSGTGLSQYDGAVVWFPEGRGPAFWRGMWTRTECFTGKNSYEYDYSTEIRLYPEKETQVRLYVKVTGRAPKIGEIYSTFSCVARQMPDGAWRFLVENGQRHFVERLLRIRYLNGIHDQLRHFLTVSNILRSENRRTDTKSMVAHR